MAQIRSQKQTQNHTTITKQTFYFFDFQEPFESDADQEKKRERKNLDSEKVDLNVGTFSRGILF